MILAGQAADGERGPLLARLQPSLLKVTGPCKLRESCWKPSWFTAGMETGFHISGQDCGTQIELQPFPCCVCVSTSQHVPYFVYLMS